MNCFIGMKRETGFIKGVFCGMPTTPSRCGSILFHHYKSTSKVEKLISLGRIEFLGEKLEPNFNEEHSFAHRQKYTVLASYRDTRTANSIEILRAKDLNNLLDTDNLKNKVEYIYLWNMKSKCWQTYVICSEYENGKVKFRYYTDLLEFYATYHDATVNDGFMTAVHDSKRLKPEYRKSLCRR